MTRISWLAALAGSRSSPCSRALAAMRRRRAWMQRREQGKLPYRGGGDPRPCPLLRWAGARARVSARRTTATQYSWRSGSPGSSRSASPSGAFARFSRAHGALYGTFGLNTASCDSGTGLWPKSQRARSRFLRRRPRSTRRSRTRRSPRRSLRQQLPPDPLLEPCGALRGRASCRDRRG